MHAVMHTKVRKEHMANYRHEPESIGKVTENFSVKKSCPFPSVLVEL